MGGSKANTEVFLIRDLNLERMEPHLAVMELLQTSKQSLGAEATNAEIGNEAEEIAKRQSTGVLASLG